MNVIFSFEFPLASTLHNNTVTKRLNITMYGPMTDVCYIPQ